MNLFLFIYLTTTLNDSPSTETTAIPAGTAIVSLSELTVSLATTLPKIVAMTTFLPSAPLIMTAPSVATTETALFSALISSFAVALSSLASIVKCSASSRFGVTTKKLLSQVRRSPI